MKAFNCAFPLSDPNSKSCLCSLFIVASLICAAYFIGSAFFAPDYIEILPRPQNTISDKCKVSPEVERNDGTRQERQSSKCKNLCRPSGSEALPEGIVARTSNLDMRPLWGSIANNNKAKPSVNLISIAVGVKQKQLVSQIVEKFLENDFVVMLFHYDGIVDEWNDLEWSGRVIHVAAMNQTKWWFAKRFLHPDIVAEYDYIFLWDEDLGVEHFHPGRYLSIVKDEGLEISQPSLDPAKSEVHHQITARLRNSKAKVHRRMYKFKGNGRCDDKSTAPPCIGWVEMMAPVFSRAAWQCAWYMIQNDLIHAWGLDMQLGYCAQGDRTKNVGVVDSEYVIHLGLPTLGVSDEKKKIRAFGQLDLHKLVMKSRIIIIPLIVEAPGHSSQAKNLADSDALESSVLHRVDNRSEVRRQSYIEMRMFRSRWRNAVENDKCWVDPYKRPAK